MIANKDELITLATSLPHDGSSSGMRETIARLCTARDSVSLSVLVDLHLEGLITKAVCEERLRSEELYLRQINDLLKLKTSAVEAFKRYLAH